MKISLPYLFLNHSVFVPHFNVSSLSQIFLEIYSVYMRKYIYLFFKDFIYLFMRDTQREAEGEACSMHREPDVGFDPRSPGSRPGPKAGAKLLRHPGIPAIGVLSNNDVVLLKMPVVPTSHVLMERMPRGVLGSSPHAESVSQRHTAKCLPGVHIAHLIEEIIRKLLTFPVGMATWPTCDHNFSHIQFRNEGDRASTGRSKVKRSLCFPLQWNPSIW